MWAQKSVFSGGESALFSVRSSEFDLGAASQRDSRCSRGSSSDDEVSNLSDEVSNLSEGDDDDDEDDDDEEEEAGHATLLATIDMAADATSPQPAHPAWLGLADHGTARARSSLTRSVVFGPSSSTATSPHPDGAEASPLDKPIFRAPLTPPTPIIASPAQLDAFVAQARPPESFDL